MPITFMQAAAAMPWFTACVIAVCLPIIGVILFYYVLSLVRYQRFLDALELPKAAIRFWEEVHMCDETDDAGNYTHTRHVRKLYMQRSGQLRVELVTSDGPIGAYVREIVRSGFILQDAPAPAMPPARNLP